MGVQSHWVPYHLILSLIFYIRMHMFDDVYCSNNVYSGMA